jgi:hypothetical protein
MRVTLFLLVSLALTGCKLVDQTTFAPSPEANPPMPVTPSVDPRAPLVTIGYDIPNPNYKEFLDYAVQAAQSRAPNVEYDVIAMLPAGGDLALVQQEAVEVMRVIQAQHIPAARIHLGLREQPKGTPRQIRVYVR